MRHTVIAPSVKGHPLKAWRHYRARLDLAPYRQQCAWSLFRYGRWEKPVQEYAVTTTWCTTDTSQWPSVQQAAKEVREPDGFAPDAAWSDDVPVVLTRDEFPLNRHQQAKLASLAEERPRRRRARSDAPSRHPR